MLKSYSQQLLIESTIKWKQKYFLSKRNCFYTINIKITFKNFTISYPHCFSHCLYGDGKDHYGYQKYICRKSFIFILKQNFLICLFITFVRVLVYLTLLNLLIILFLLQSQEQFLLVLYFLRYLIYYCHDKIY